MILADCEFGGTSVKGPESQNSSKSADKGELGGSRCCCGVIFTRVHSFSGRSQQFVIGIAIVGAIIAASVERSVRVRGLGR